MNRNNNSRKGNAAHDADTVLITGKSVHRGIRYRLYRFALIMALSAFFIGGCTANEIPEAGMDAWDKEESSLAAEEAETAVENDAESETEADEKTASAEKSKSDEPADSTENKKIVAATDKVKEGLLSIIQKKPAKTEWVKYDDLESAQNASGLIISKNVLTQIKDYDQIEYRAIENTMIEVIFRDKNGTEGYRFRQGYGTGDISGDNKDYDDDNEYKIGKTIVHTKGSNGHIAVASYTDGKLTYAFVGAAYQPTLLELMGMYYLFG